VSAARSLCSQKLHKPLNHPTACHQSLLPGLVVLCNGLPSRRSSSTLTCVLTYVPTPDRALDKEIAPYYNPLDLKSDVRIAQGDLRPAVLASRVQGVA